jgi:hypothetical protein
MPKFMRKNYPPNYDMVAVLADYTNARCELRKTNSVRDALSERAGSLEGISKAFASQLITVKEELEANEKILR